ncbi:MAG: CoA-binding protein [Planctomycetota bacterium]
MSPTRDERPTTDEQIARFFTAPCYAVVGASNDMAKYGAKIFAAYLQRGLTAFPINPSQTEVQGAPAFARLADLPQPCASVSVITPPQVTEQVVADAVAAGVENVWLQPGAESSTAVAYAQEKGLNVIHGGPCILVSFATL